MGRFNVGGGIEILPEFAALLLALSVYTAAFIAEVVRAGMLAVPRGQTEAAQALGLRSGTTLRLIVIPQAMRVIVPPLTSQYLNLTKNSSLAVAIGYPDLVQVFAGSVLNITGQAVEVIAITMAVYLAISLVTSLLMNLYGRTRRHRGALTRDGRELRHPELVSAPDAGANDLPPPATRAGLLGWLRANLFSSPLNIALTLVCALLIVWVGAAVAPVSSDRRGVVRGRPRSMPCLARQSGPGRLLGLRAASGSPISSTASIRSAERWRVDVFFAALAFGIVWLLWLSAPRREIGALYFFIVLPVLSFVLLYGLPLIGLAECIDDAVGRRAGDGRRGHHRHRGFAADRHIAGAGAPLEDSRRCELLSVIFIEFVRGVPLITVLFMASVMLPLFVPERLEPDKLVRALIGVAHVRVGLYGGGGARRPCGDPARPIRGGAGAGLGLLAHDGAGHPAAGAAGDAAEHRQHLYRPVQGHDAGLHRRDFRFPAHHRGGARRSEMGRRRSTASPAMPLPRCSISSAATACRATRGAWKRDWRADRR